MASFVLILGIFMSLSISNPTSRLSPRINKLDSSEPISTTGMELESITLAPQGASNCGFVSLEESFSSSSSALAHPRRDFSHQQAVSNEGMPAQKELKTLKDKFALKIENQVSLLKKVCIALKKTVRNDSFRPVATSIISLMPFAG